jgi:hypothetical protein
MRHACVCLIIVLMSAGCSDRPKAPPLRDEPVFDDPRTGLRFVAPPGWVQIMRSAELPTGPLEREWVLVRYQSPPGEQPATFEATLLDAPESADMAALVTAESHSLGPWRLANQPQALAVAGLEATRYTVIFKNTTKESVVVRRGGRLWFLTGVFGVKDAQAQTIVRQVVESVTWGK